MIEKLKSAPVAYENEPFLSSPDGRILRMSTSTLGGITMYTVDTDARLVYYYAHMDRYNDAMSPGRTIVHGTRPSTCASSTTCSEAILESGYGTNVLWTG